jgi:FkbM family methyltransferase
MKKKLDQFLDELRTEGIKSAVLMSMEYIRENVLPQSVLIMVYPVYSLVSPQMKLGIIFPEDDIYKVIRISGNDFYIPDLSPNLYTLSDLQSGNGPESIQHNLDKYSSDDMISVEGCKYIVDCGAFIGAMSIGVAREAEKVISIEPSTKNAECIRNNAREFGVRDKIIVVEKPVYSERTSMTFNLSEDPTDNSLIRTDTSQVKSKQVETTTIDILTSKHDMSQVDFLKMDAEGVEPEVLIGAKTTRIEQIAIDCSAERNGESSYQKLRELLTNRGYRTNRAEREDDWDVIYGRLTEQNTTAEPNLTKNDKTEQTDQILSQEETF